MNLSPTCPAQAGTCAALQAGGSNQSWQGGRRGQEKSSEWAQQGPLRSKWQIISGKGNI